MSTRFLFHNDEEDEKPQLLIQPESVNVSLRRHPHVPEMLIRYLVILMGSISLLICFNGFFHFPVSIGFLSLLTFGIVTVMQILRRLHPKLGIAGMVVSAFSIPVALLRHLQEVAAGGSSMMEMIRSSIMMQETFESSFPEEISWTESQCIQLIFIIAIIAIVTILHYTDMMLMRSKSSSNGAVLRFIIPFLFLEMGLYFGMESSSIAIFALLFFWICSWVLRRYTPKEKVKADSRSCYKYADMMGAEWKYATYETSAAVLLFLMSLLCAATLILTRNYVRSEEMNQKRREFRQWYQNLTIEDVTGLLYHLPFSSSANIVTDELNLVNNGDVHFDGRTDLHVTIGKNATVDDYYFRGTVRSVYTGSGWGNPNGIYRRNKKLFSQLTQENLTAQTIFHSDHITELQIPPENQYPAVPCEVIAMNQPNCNYAPYQSVFEAGTLYHYDTEIELPSYQNYSFWLLNNASIDWNDISDRTAPSQNPLVGKYEQFAEETYLGVPETEAMHQVYEDMKQAIPEKPDTLIGQLDAIRDYIWSRAEYTTAAGLQPADRDYVEYFLNEGHKGYCAHYASAAVVLCRMNGIPARYCQGYVLPSTAFASYTDTGSYKINILDKQSHAWAEIYVKGFGWVPYEFTESVAEEWHRISEEPADITETTATVTETVTTYSETVSFTETEVQSLTETAVSGNTAEENPISEEPAHPIIPKQVRVILTALAVIAVIAAVYIRIHKGIIRKRIQQMQQASPNDAAMASYQFIVKLLRIQGIEQQKLSYEAFAKAAEAHSGLAAKGRISETIAIIQAAAFSRNGVTAGDAKRLYGTAMQMASAMYEKAGFFRRIWLRWGRHIVE
ncbi:MAG: transglutaminase-like domain-containing protein [Oscillospiraceae bacterium]|nr:transglutaminase-like domain-containing protein [Oscillospiraceae bacterium]